MSLHVVTLTSLWLSISICVSGLSIYFSKKRTVNQKPSTADVLHFIQTLPMGFWERREGVLGKGGNGDPPTVYSLLETVGMLSHHLRLHVGLHHQFSFSVRAPSPTNADSGSMESRNEHC